MAVLSGVVLFASSVMYTYLEDDKLNWNIITSEEGRYIHNVYIQCHVYTCSCLCMYYVHV